MPASQNDICSLWVVGLRGIPNITGGIEQWAVNVYPRLAARGMHVTLVNRSRYFQEKKPTFQGVKLIYIPSVAISGVENFLHTFVSIICAKMNGAHVIHIHGVGPSFWAPLARLLNIHVCIFHHGRDYMRAKWGIFAKAILKLGEIIGSYSAHVIFLVNPAHKHILPTSTQSKSQVIFNGGVPLSANEILVKHDVTLQRLLFVGRITPEKNLLWLIQQFKSLPAALSHLKLDIIGAAGQGSQKYFDDVVKNCNGNVAFLGEKNSTEVLSEYKAGTALVLPSQVEGLPLICLDALYRGTPLLLSDIPEHEFLGRDFGASIFSLQDSSSFTEAVKNLVQNPPSRNELLKMSEKAQKFFNWETISELVAQHTLKLATRR